MHDNGYTITWMTDISKYFHHHASHKNTFYQVCLCIATVMHTLVISVCHKSTMCITTFKEGNFCVIPRNY